MIEDETMRKQNKLILWPTYFDSTKTRMNGRRIPKNLAVPTPKLKEIYEAAEKIGLQSETNSNAKHPITPWSKTGSLIVNKKESKTKTIRKIAEELRRKYAQTHKN
jgi:signal recognition particle subunit SRP19